MRFWPLLRAFIWCAVSATLGVSFPKYHALISKTPALAIGIGNFDLELELIVNLNSSPALVVCDTRVHASVAFVAQTVKLIPSQPKVNVASCDQPGNAVPAESEYNAQTS